MTELGLTRKEEIWLACKQKSCCYAAFVVPSGRDIWRIAHTLDSPPWAFLVYFPAQAPRRDAFHLDHSGVAYRVALAKGATRRKKAPPNAGKQCRNISSSVSHSSTRRTFTRRSACPRPDAFEFMAAEATRSPAPGKAGRGDLQGHWPN